VHLLWYNTCLDVEAASDGDTRLSVIDSLSAGYRFLGRRLELLLIPVLLDLFLLWGPRLGVTPLIQQMVDNYGKAIRSQAAEPDVVQFFTITSSMLTELAPSINLYGWLVNSSLLRVPGLMIGESPMAGPVTELDSLGLALGLMAALGLAGILVGVVYLNLLARRLPIGAAAKPVDAGTLVRLSLRQWLRIVAFVVGIGVAFILVSIPASVAILVVGQIAPGFMAILLMLLVGAWNVLFFYLYFVPPAIVMDDLPILQAIVQSFRLVARNFWSTLGFFLIYNLIAIGIGAALLSMAEWTAVGAVAAILVYAYIGSGLTMALLVFYRTRVISGQESQKERGV
jgi:hypothetical protein